MAQATAQAQDFTPHSTGLDPSSSGRVAQENLERFAAGFFEGAGPALTTVLNRPVTVELVGVSSVRPADLLVSAPLPWVLVEATYQRGFTGTHWMVVPRTSALALGEALVGAGEGEPGEIAPAYQEAIREAINQVLTAAGPTLMPLLGRATAFAPATVHLMDDAEALPAELAPNAEQISVVTARAQAGDAFQVDLLLTLGPALARTIGALGTEQTASDGAEARRGTGQPSKIDFLLDVTLPVTVELGRARMQIQDILKLAPGSVIELDKAAGDPVELLINERPIAKGEVVIIDENFGIRLTSIVTATERIKTLR